VFAAAAVTGALFGQAWLAGPAVGVALISVAAAMFWRIRRRRLGEEWVRMAQASVAARLGVVKIRG
jgi:hypothetical protein